MSMIVIMHEAATEEDVAHVCARVEEVGASLNTAEAAPSGSQMIA